MNTYRIRFSGIPIGRLSHVGETVTREVEAVDAKSAELRAYDTHEHIHSRIDVSLIRLDCTND